MADLPTTLNAGDDYTWTEDADSATAVTYFFTNPTGEVCFSCKASVATDVATFTLTPSDTATLEPGLFRVNRTEVVDSLKATTQAADLKLLPNPDGSSALTYAQQCVTLLEAHVKGRLPQGLENHSIDGQQITKISIPEAQNMLNKYRAEMQAESDLLAGKGGASNRILYSFP